MIIKGKRIMFRALCSVRISILVNGEFDMCSGEQ